MTEEQRKRVAENPKEFLQSCRYHEQSIKIKLEQIRHYRELAESITAEIKEVTTFSLTPSNKIENCAIELVSIEEDIKKEIQELRNDLILVKEVIDLLTDETLRTLMDARYIRQMSWEEIAVMLFYTRRRVLQLHNKALQEISRKISL